MALHLGLRAARTASPHPRRPPPPSLFSAPRRRRPTPCRTQRAALSAYGYGQQWTGALSRGRARLDAVEAPEVTPDELLHFGDCQTLVPLEGAEGTTCAAAAGWGHTALLVSDEGASARRLMVCGRPHDFQTLLRLQRLPHFLRKFCVRHTLPTEGEPLAEREPSVPQRIATYLAGERITFHEEECRVYSNVPTLLEVALPDGETPAAEGDAVEDAGSERRPSRSPLHTRFQNTLAAGAGVTAVISKTGTLYTFGLNQRGQCGSGSFTPNVWTPGRVAGLASTRFILDHGADVAGDMFKQFKEQENPVVSVALGLQHGVALDSQGQVFCWGKGERGQLGQGRKLLPNRDKEEEPYANRTFDHALHVANFHDPYSTHSPSPDEMYAPLLSPDDARVRLVAAGMNFTLAVTESNLPYVWGKNVRLDPDYSPAGLDPRAKPVRDAVHPRHVPGLPPGLRIERVACGTHHAALLLEDGSVWAVGVATDRPAPLWDAAVEVLAAGLVEVAGLRSFAAGFDRTTVAYDAGDGRREALEIQLWSTEELRRQGAVRPSLLEWLERERPGERVRAVHRGWKHSVVVTEG